MNARRLVSSNESGPRLVRRSLHAACVACLGYLSGCAYPGGFHLSAKTPSIQIDLTGESDGAGQSRAPATQPTGVTIEGGRFMFSNGNHAGQ